jgi:hypothetical protein
MAILILIGLLVLLVGGLVFALMAAKHAQRELEDLEDEFAEHRGIPRKESGDTPPPWSPFDLDVLRDDVTEVTGSDPYATLTGVDPVVSENATDSAPSWNPADSAPSWNAASSLNLEPEPNGFEPEPNGYEATTDLAPIKDLRPVAWRASADAPVVVLVVGAGFLGTGVTAGLTTADRLQRAWGKINDSFGDAGVITLNPDPVPSAAPPLDDNGSKAEDAEDVVGADTAAWPRPRRHRVEPAPPPEQEVSPISARRAERRRTEVFAPPDDEFEPAPRATRRSADVYPSPDAEDESPRTTSSRAPRRRADRFPPPDVEDEFRRTTSPRAARRRAEAVAPPEPDEDFSRDSSPRAERGRTDAFAPPEDELPRISPSRLRRPRTDVLFPRLEEDARKSSPPPRPRRSRPRPSEDPEPITWRPPPTRR